MDTSRVNRWKQKYAHSPPPPPLYTHFLSLPSLSAPPLPPPHPSPGLFDVGKVGGMAGLMHQCGQRFLPRPNGGRVGEGRKVSLRRLPRTVPTDPCDLRPVAETVRVFPFAVEQVQYHLRPLVLDPHSRERPPPPLHRRLEGKERIKLRRHVTRRRLADVPRVQRVRAVGCRQLCPRFFHQPPGPLLLHRSLGVGGKSVIDRSVFPIQSTYTLALCRSRSSQTTPHWCLYIFTSIIYTPTTIHTSTSLNASKPYAMHHSYTFHPAARTSNVSRISNSASLPNPSACVTL